MNLLAKFLRDPGGYPEFIKNCYMHGHAARSAGSFKIVVDMTLGKKSGVGHRVASTSVYTQWTY